MTVRYYSSIAPEVTLTAGVNNVDTVIIVSDTTGFPINTPYTLALDYGGATEELVQVNSVAGTSLTVTRAIDGTSAASHGAGSKVRHVSSARDFKDSRDHENATADVHGTDGDVVGTDGIQTLFRKTLKSFSTGHNAATIDAVTGQAVPIVRVRDGLGNDVARVTATGQLQSLIATTSANLIANATSPGVMALMVTDPTLGNILTADSSKVQISVPLVVGGSTDVTTTALMTAATGWSIAANTIGVVKNSMITINGNITRTGANIAIDAAGAPAGGIQAMATIDALYRQKSTLGTLYFHAGNSIATGTLRMASAGGTIELVRWQASQTISTGNTLSFTLTYPLS